ncbi:MAG: virulence RhuM family protein, partial [Paludibacter sp.]|nr:virulence RhuM family protein [Paludibacter sp.]
MNLNKLNKNQPDFVIYETDDKIAKVSVRLEEETVWLTQAHLADLFQTSRPNITMHIKNILENDELQEVSVCKDFLHTAADGKNYNTKYYNLDMIISLGYRINSKVATKFRQWATERLKEYIVKGFTLDDERLKNGGGRYFRELLQRIRDIRSSERNLWQQVTDIYATSVDYNPKSYITAEFFATVQNKMHYAVHRQTAAEVIYHRVDNEKIMLGMSN